MIRSKRSHLALLAAKAGAEFHDLDADPAVRQPSARGRLLSRPKAWVAGLPK